jgi:hypothetical protein
MYFKPIKIPAAIIVSIKPVFKKSGKKLIKGFTRMIKQKVKIEAQIDNKGIERINLIE